MKRLTLGELPWKYSKLRVKPIAGGLELDVGIPGNRIVGANITKTGSSFTYDTRFCRAGAPPR